MLGAGRWALRGAVRVLGTAPTYVCVCVCPHVCPYTQDPGLEGERVLHELEVLPPAHLYDCLLGTALAGAVQVRARGLEGAGGGYVHGFGVLCVYGRTAQGRDVLIVRVHML